MAELVDHNLGDFHLLRHIGSGGMADVYLAQQISLQRHVAVKVLRHKQMLNSQLDVVAQFRKEAMLAAGLNHPNIVQVYMIGVQDNYHYIAQEFVQGATLLSLIERKGRLETGLFLSILRQIAAALKAAENAGIVHRDIKPGNILVSQKGEVKVADFGTGLLCNERNPLEMPGFVTGTPLYMSPEQISGLVLDSRTDIYSLGVTCYQMLCGETPFVGTSSREILQKHLRITPPQLKSKNPGLPTTLCCLVHLMMAKDRSQRYQTAEALLDDVKSLATAFRQGRSLDRVKLSHLARLTLRTEPQCSVGVANSTVTATTTAEQAERAGAGADQLMPRKTQSEASKSLAQKKQRSPVAMDGVSVCGALLQKSRFSINHEDLIDMTAMVDIVFFLLIFFLVTSMNGVRSSLPMPVPKTADGMGGAGSVVVPETEEAKDSDDNSIAVTIDSSDRVRVDGIQIPSADELLVHLKAVKESTVGLPSLLISGHGEATHGAMVEVLDAGHEAGFETLRFTIDNSLVE